MESQSKSQSRSLKQMAYVDQISDDGIFKNYLDMRVWQLRHLQVSKFIQTHSITKILDVGCAQGTLINRLSRSQRIQKLIGIDFNQAVLKKAENNVCPELMQDTIRYLRKEPLTVELYQLNMLQLLPLKQFEDIELVTLIQFIEHIQQNNLGILCEQVFKKINPKFVMITTPNQQFNVHFNFKPKQMRHPQHLFQWNRSQFKQFCSMISKQFDYEYEIFGVGEHISDNQFGYCSQGAFFKRIGKSNYIFNQQQLKITQPRVRIRYPFWKDKIDAMIKSQIKYYITRNNYESPATILQEFKKCKIYKKIEQNGGEVDGQKFDINQAFIIEQASNIKYCGYQPDRNWLYYEYQSSRQQEHREEEDQILQLSENSKMQQQKQIDI